MTKFQSLTKKEKVEHIWEYYRYHILGTVFGLFILFNLISTIFGPRPPEPAANVVIMGLYRHDEDKIASFKESISGILDEGNDEIVGVDMFLVDWESTSPMDAAMNQKLVLMLQAKEIDVLIVEKSKFDSQMEILEEGMYEPLEDQGELAQILQENSDKLIKRKAQNDIEERVYGLSVKGNEKLQDIGLGDEYIVAIPTITDKKDNALKTIKWLFE